MNTKLRTFKSHEAGDLLVRFQLELSTADRELIEKFGDPDIQVGGSFFTAATIHPVITAEAIVSVVVDTAGVAGTYSSTVAVGVDITDADGGTGAMFSVTLNENGTIASVAVTAGGTGYGGGTALEISGDHVTIYPSQTVKLLTSFPYTRRINTIVPGDASLATLASLYISSVTNEIDTALSNLRTLETSGADLTGELVSQP